MVQRFKVSGMSCGHCVRSVTEALHNVDQAASVEVDLAGGIVTVASNAEAAILSAAIADAGYDVQASA